MIGMSALVSVRGTMTSFLVLLSPGPQWGAADAEIKVPSGENTELKIMFSL